MPALRLLEGVTCAFPVSDTFSINVAYHHNPAALPPTPVLPQATASELASQRATLQGDIDVGRHTTETLLPPAELAALTEDIEGARAEQLWKTACVRQWAQKDIEMAPQHRCLYHSSPILL